MRWSADASGEGDGGVLLVRVPVAALAPDAAGAGEDRGGPGRSDVQLPGVRDILDGRRRTSRLGNVLLSPLPQTGLAQAAREAGQDVRPRVRRPQGRFTRRARTPFPTAGGRQMVRSDGPPGGVGGIDRVLHPGPRGWCPHARDDRECDPGTLRRAGQAGAGLGGHDEQCPVAARGCGRGNRTDALVWGCESIREGRPVHRQRGPPDVRRGRGTGLHHRSQLPVGVLALAKGAPTGGGLAHDPQDPGQHPR